MRKGLQRGETALPLQQALKIPRGITAFVGGGGKSSLLLALGRELAREHRVILCTSTHIYAPENVPLLERAELPALKTAFENHSLLCLGEREGAKLIPSVMPYTGMRQAADYVLVEADGAKGLPLKAHLPHEPVIPAGCDAVVYLLGADGFYQPVKTAAHRAELYAKLLGLSPEDPVKPEDALKAVDFGDRVFINKVETEERLQAAREFARAYKKRTVLGALKYSPQAWEVWEDGVCVYSCGAPGIWPAAWPFACIGQDLRS